MSPIPTGVMIVAHGQPSDPGPAAAALDRFAAGVATALGPDAPAIRAATLADPGAVGAAAAGLGQGRFVVYPMFMAPGWFTRAALPARLAEAGHDGVTILAPFGTEPALAELAETLIAGAVSDAGWAATETRLLLAAHGSFKSAAPAEIARDFATGLAGRMRLGGAAAAFIDQEPRLATMRGWPERSLCLPFFAASGGHVEQDLPRALAEAGFPGPCLPAIGTAPQAMALVAESLRRALA